MKKSYNKNLSVKFDQNIKNNFGIFLIFLALFLLQNSLAAAGQDKQKDKNENYHARSKGYSSNPESDPPQYVYQLDQTGIEAFKNLNWIDAGLNYRMRFESRKNDFRRSRDTTDNVFLSRTQAYFGIKEIIDPLRFAFELQDSRRHNSKFPKSRNDVNELDLFQGYGELYFKEPFLIDRPISLRAGKMAYEVLDRKMFSRDEWGNTGTNFRGLRATVGEAKSDWQFDSFALQPMKKEIENIDRHNQDIWVYAALLNWRRWSDSITIQPFYFRLDQKHSDDQDKRNIHSPGLRFYGVVGDSNFDYDFIGVGQFGGSANETHRAYAYATEIGYTQNHQWQPRYSLVYGYASGDKNPHDTKNQRFERFYGFNRPWSNSNHIEWENLEALKSRIEFKPTSQVRIESSYSFYWLANASDTWTRGNLRDESGRNGKAIGQDFDFRALFPLNKNLRATLGYAHFIPGKFARNVGRDGSSDFIYLELTFNIFGNKTSNTPKPIEPSEY